MKHTILLLTGLLISAISELSAANLTLAGTFTDHAVLQRDAVTPVWGWADPNEQVTVAFAGQSKSATADAAGKWMVKLDPMPASVVGRDLVVQSSIKNRQSKITDVLVGDVWLCSGQSNMHFRLKTVENATKEIAAANHPALRFFTVDHQFAQKTCANVAGAWMPASPATVAECSAVAYYFGRDLVQRLGVPVGLLVSSVGGIHPNRKQPVGARLALAARALSYGEQIEYSGPVFDNLRVEGNRAVISFTHLGDGLVAQGDSLKGFTMAGADGKFIPARAVIEGATVVVTSEKITKAAAVRYGWAMVPDGNLFNREGLPAVPFRTDSPADLTRPEKSK